MTASRKHRWHLQLLHLPFVATSIYPIPLAAIPRESLQEGKWRGESKLFFFFLLALQLQGALINTAVTRTQTLSPTCPSFPSSPCSWLLGVVNQHPLAPWTWGLFGVLPKTPLRPSNEGLSSGSALDEWELKLSRVKASIRKRGKCSSMTQSLSNESKRRTMCQEFKTSQVWVWE